jgi:hypothetical protein
VNIRLITGLLILSVGSSLAGEFKTEASYKYMFAKQWDKAIQTYNFSRPFITNKQPLLMHGISTSASYLFNTTKKFQQGINIAYAYFGSMAENENLTNRLNLHFLNLGYLFHYENQETLPDFYTELIISATTSGLYRHTNGKPFVYDETKSRAFGIGGDIGLRFGYYLPLKNKFCLSPFIAIGYTPYFFSPNTEVVINQTRGLTGKSWTGIVSGQVGFSLHIRPEAGE